MSTRIQVDINKIADFEIATMGPRLRVRGSYIGPDGGYGGIVIQD